MNWKEESNRIYCDKEDGTLISEVTYYLSDQIVTVDHVFVDPAYRGQKIADEAMLKIVALVRKNNWKLQATCPYAIAWIDKNGMKYRDILI